MNRQLHLSLWVLAVITAVGWLAAGNARAAGAQSSKVLSLFGYVSSAPSSPIMSLSFSAMMDERFAANDSVNFTISTSGTSGKKNIVCSWTCEESGAAVAPLLSTVRTNPSVSSVSIAVGTSQIPCTATLGSGLASCTLPSAIQLICNENGQSFIHATATDTIGYQSGPIITSHLLAIGGPTDCTAQLDDNALQGNGFIEYSHYVNH